MGLGQLYLETGMNKVEHAIHLLQVWEPEEGYYLAFSGGKDSVVCYDLLQKANLLVPFEAHYSVSPIDPPQIYKFIKTNYPDVIWDYHARGFWNMVVKKGLPMRTQRWCCQVIKEGGGTGRTVIVGNRHAESSRRKSQCFVDVDRRDSSKRILRPILHFTDYDVWQYIKENNLSYCSLYDEGFKRLGCVLCPFSNDVKREELFFPKIVKNWKRACDQIVAEAKARNYLSKRGHPLKHKFDDGEELYRWWTSRRA